VLGRIGVLAGLAVTRFHDARGVTVGSGDRSHAPGGQTEQPGHIAPWWMQPGWTAAGLALTLYAAVRATGVLMLAAFAAATDQNLWDLLSRYDAIWYQRIAQGGYDAAIPVAPGGTLAHTDLAFFPLYPVLLSLFDPVLPGGLRAAALGVSWTAGMAAAAGLYAVGAHLRDRPVGVVLAVLWAVLPHAIVESMGYSETLFTACAAWSLWAVLRRQWLTAAVLCVLAGLSRPTGVALLAAVGPAAFVAIVKRRDSWRPWAAMLVAPVGWLSYVAWVGHRLGRPDGYFHVQSGAWKMSFDGGGYTYRTLLTVLTEPQPLAMYVTTGVALVGLAMLLLAALERVPWPLLVYAGMVLVIAVGGAGFYYAKARLLLPAFPLLLPAAYGLAAARIRTAVVVFGVLALLSGWYGAYLLLVWTASP
jgi:hypothetical protein